MSAVSGIRLGNESRRRTTRIAYDETRIDRYISSREKLADDVPKRQPPSAPVSDPDAAYFP
ncbi:hypothetical protein C6Q09_12385 [Burkholderia multivorans]|uniref:hypothetical protein n=1 Tax=Burkholderia multivorans TaxID=87883 RepID=UPI000D007541|nr:hypothetical protein [Burkholderia multivorans]PRF71228.1 hypothetical protein C6Q09_12385 [Burkholderia multivorans]